MERIQISMGSWMDKLTVAYTYNGMLFSLIKAWNSDVCYNMDESWKYYMKWKKLETKGHTGKDFTCTRYLDIHRDTKKNVVVRGGEAAGRVGSYYLMGTEFYLGRWENSGGTTYWWCLHSVGNVLNATEFVNLRMVKLVNFTFVYFTIIKNWKTYKM